MSKAAFPLETLAVASPCDVSWNRMAGDDRVRFCDQCRRHVYNLSELTRSEAESLVERAEGRLCVRFYRRADGKVMTSDCPMGLQAARRRLTLAVSAGVATFVVAVGWALTLLGSSRNSEVTGRRFRDIEPLHTIMEWINPTPPTAVMGAICIPEPPVNSAGPKEPIPAEPTVEVLP